MPPLNNLLTIILVFVLLICSLATIKRKSSFAFSKAGVRPAKSCLQRNKSLLQRQSNLWQCEGNKKQRSVPAKPSSFNLKCVGETVLLFLPTMCVIQSSTQTPGRTGLTTPLCDLQITTTFLQSSPQPKPSECVARGGNNPLLKSCGEKAFRHSEFCPSEENCCLWPTKNPNASLQRLKTMQTKTLLPTQCVLRGALPLFQPQASWQKEKQAAKQKEKRRTVCDDKILPQAKNRA